MPLAVIALLALAPVAPFEDTQKRFVIDLPEGWQFAPQPGDITGAAFQRHLHEIPANCFVKVLPLGPHTTLEQLAARLSAGVNQEPGYEQLEEKLDLIDGLPAIRRRYVVHIRGDTKWTKMAEDLFAVADGKGFWIHVETLAEAFGTFEADFNHLMRSFRPEHSGKALDPPGPSLLVGRWAMIDAEATILELRADGTFDLAGTRGVYEVKEDELITLPVGGHQEIFTWRVEGDQLVLSAKSLPRPMRYVRADQSTLAQIVGKWRNADHTLELSPGGTVIFDGASGTYRVDGGLLVLRVGRKKKRVVLEVEVKGDTLVVTGKKVGKNVELRRQ